MSEFKAWKKTSLKVGASAAVLLAAGCTASSKSDKTQSPVPSVETSVSATQPQIQCRNIEGTLAPGKSGDLLDPSGADNTTVTNYGFQQQTPNGIQLNDNLVTVVHRADITSTYFVYGFSELRQQLTDGLQLDLVVSPLRVPTVGSVALSGRICG